MTPIITFCAMPPGEAMGDQRSVNAAGELLHAGKQRSAVHDNRKGLDQPDIRMRAHRGSQADDRLPRHHAVRVEDHHLRIRAAEVTDPVADVSRLPLGVETTMAVKDAVVTAGTSPQREKGRLLGDPY